MLLNAVFNSIKIMKTISITELTDAQWQKYFELNQNLNRKYAPDFYQADCLVEEFKKDKLKFHNESHPFNHAGYVIFNDDITKAVAWFDYTNFGKTLGLNFDVESDVIDTEIFRIILPVVYEAMLKGDKDIAAHCWYFNERRINALKKLGAEIYDKHIMSRLYRKDMDINFYKKIIEKTKFGSEFSVKYFDKHPIDLIPGFVDMINDMNKDIMQLNPHNIEILEQTEDDIKRYIKNFSEFRMHMLMIFDGNGEIAAMSELYENVYGGKKLWHGMTAVVKKYRGREFGKFLKVSLYVKALEENIDFDFIQTDTMPWNKYMYRINEELGFKKYKEGFEFKLTKEFLENYLNVHEPVI